MGKLVCMNYPTEFFDVPFISKKKMLELVKTTSVSVGDPLEPVKVPKVLRRTKNTLTVEMVYPDKKDVVVKPELQGGKEVSAMTTESVVDMPKRKRGRPPKVQSETIVIGEPKRKRGRPPKIQSARRGRPAVFKPMSRKAEKLVRRLSKQIQRLQKLNALIAAELSM